ncbi:MAG: type IV pilus secretin PilQ [Proteobacteria bacterium]|nr:type IV pilus secretin PilQ [Pseudomonadota bacterium]
MTALFLGCAPDRTQKPDPFFDKWRARAEESKANKPTKVKDELGDNRSRLTRLQKELRAEFIKPLPKKKITVKLRDLPAAVALHAVARAVDQNILINETVQGKVTLDVKDVPWDQVFSSILSSQSLTYVWEGDIIRVMTYDEKVRNQKRAMQTRVVHIEFAEPADLQKNLQSILESAAQEKKGDGKEVTAAVLEGRVMVDAHNHALIIQATQDDIDRLVPLIASLDQPTSQVLIEAHIVETTKETALDLGVQWGGLSKDSAGNWFYPGANSSGIWGQTVGDPTFAPNTGPMVNFPVTDITQAGFTLGFLAETTGSSMLALELSALQRDGKLNILSSPSITTLDNSAAVIESGAEVPYRTYDKDGQPVIQFKKATLRLEVTPHVIGGEQLKLKIDTKKDELDWTNPIDGNPTILTKNAQTHVILLDGQTTVIGGLNKENATNTETGVPGLKNIPILGWLFKGLSESNKMEEVLIFITPHILKEKGAEKAQVRPDDTTGSEPPGPSRPKTAPPKDGT